MENSMEVPWKTKNRATIWPNNPTTGHILRENHNSKDTCTSVFIAALLTIARTWKPPKCPSIEEWIKKKWYIYTVEYYSAIKRNEIELFLEMWVDLETVIQREVSQKDENKYRILTHICGIWKNWYRWPYSQSRIRDTDIENKHGYQR